MFGGMLLTLVCLDDQEPHPSVPSSRSGGKYYSGPSAAAPTEGNGLMILLAGAAIGVAGALFFSRTGSN
jgi:hypothetical protein